MGKEQHSITGFLLPSQVTLGKRDEEGSRKEKRTEGFNERRPPSAFI